MVFVQPPVTTLRAAVTTFAAVAILGTGARLYHRHVLRKLWWDDLWAVGSLVAQFTLLVGLWIRTDTPDVGPLHQPHDVRIAAYWIVTLSFTCTLWAARMSMLFSIIRITPSLLTVARYTRLLIAFFASMWAALLLQKTILCGTDRSWYHEAKPQCHLGNRVGFFELSTDFVADLILLVLPIRLLMSVSTPFAQRKMLVAVFSASILTTLTSVVHAYYLVQHAGLVEALTANVEASVALIVANLAVIATWIYARLAPGDADANVHIATYPDGSGGSGGSGGSKGKKSKGKRSPAPSGGIGGVSSIHFAAQRMTNGPRETLVLETLDRPSRDDSHDMEAYGQSKSHIHHGVDFSFEDGHDDSKTNLRRLSTPAPTSDLNSQNPGR